MRVHAIRGSAFTLLIIRVASTAVDPCTSLFPLLPYLRSQRHDARILVVCAGLVSLCACNNYPSSFAISRFLRATQKIDTYLASLLSLIRSCSNLWRPLLVVPELLLKVLVLELEGLDLAGKVARLPDVARLDGEWSGASQGLEHGAGLVEDTLESSVRRVSIELLPAQAR